jgi:hypothetical protein
MLRFHWIFHRMKLWMHFTLLMVCTVQDAQAICVWLPEPISKVPTAKWNCTTTIGQDAQAWQYNSTQKIDAPLSSFVRYRKRS